MFRKHMMAPVLCVLAVALQVSSASSRPEQFSPAEMKLQIESFDLVWRTVKETHYDSTLGGLDWQGVYDRLRPRVASAKTRDEVRSIIGEMLSHLNQSHFFILPSEYYQGAKTDTLLSSDGVAGFDVRLIDGKVVVTSVMEESPAHDEGVRPGWEVVRIKGIPVTETMDWASRLYGGKTRFEFELTSAIIGSLSGEVGDSGPLVFLDGKNRARELGIVLVKRPGHYCPAVGNLSPALIDFEAKRLAGDVGYIRFNGFACVPYLVPSFNNAIDSFLACRGLIIDLRGNSGGMGGIALGMAGWFVKEKGQSLATLRSRDREDRLLAMPRPRTYDGPLAILMDGLTISAGEFLAGGLRDVGRARLFGTRTAGFSGRADIMRLPNGDVFLHTVSQHMRANGEDVEGNGIAPDEEVRPTRESLLQGRDAALDAALAWILRQSGGPGGN